MSFTPAIFIHFIVEKSNESRFQKSFTEYCCSFSDSYDFRLASSPTESTAYQIAFPIPKSESIYEAFEPYETQPEWFKLEGDDFYLLTLNQSATESDSYIIHTFFTETMLDQFILGSDAALEYMESLNKKVPAYLSAMLSYDVFLSLDGKRKKAEFNWLSSELNDNKIRKLREKLIV